MRHTRLRTALALAIAVPLAIIVGTGCASARGVSGYDGEIAPEVQTADSVTYIPFLLENHRTEANPPHILFISFGRHDLGTVAGYGGKLHTLIDKRWIAADGCVQIIAHYVGSGDLVFNTFCWRKGEHFVASLDNEFVPGSAWSHR